MSEPHILTPKARPEQDSAQRPATGEVTLATLQRQFGTIASEVSELARLVRGGAHDAVERVVDRADDVRQETTDRAKDFELQATDWIRRRPLESTLLSMGIGAILWSLLKRS